MKKPKLSEVASNTLPIMTALGAITNKAAILGIPVHEKYPPTFVLKPQKNFPFLKPMRGETYYKELQRRRRMGLE